MLFGKNAEKKEHNQKQTHDKSLIMQRDANLILQTKAGNSASFAKLISLYQNKVRALGYSFFKNSTDTDDFVQEVFIKVYTSIYSFRGDSLFSTWLMRIAYNMAINSKKRQKEYLALDDTIDVFDPDWTPEEKELRRITAEVIRQAMAEIPENYSICLDMYFFYDMSYNDISEILDVPLNTIKSHIFRAKQMLRDKLISTGFVEHPDGE